MLCSHGYKNNKLTVKVRKWSWLKATIINEQWFPMSKFVPSCCRSPDFLLWSGLVINTVAIINYY